MSSPSLLRMPRGWMKYCGQAWRLAGQPDGLSPEQVEADPIAFDKAFYNYFDARFSGRWARLRARMSVEADAADLPPEFHVTWRYHYEPTTAWKQLLPFFVYSDALGPLRSTHDELAFAFTLGQAIPSVSVDDQLDRAPPEHAPESREEISAFAVFAYSRAVEVLAKFPSSRGFLPIFLRHTQGMYRSMERERRTRFTLPESVTERDIQEYLEGEGRLLSSVFFSIGGEWAFEAAGQTAPDAFKKALIDLRRVRQLNDEIADLDEDLAGGLLTLPWRLGLAGGADGRALRKEIQEAWRDRTDPGAIQRCRTILERTGAAVRAGQHSLELLARAAEAAMIEFPFQSAFAITLLHNIRFAHLRRLHDRNYVDLPKHEQARPGALSGPMQGALPFLQQVEVLPGAGALVEQNGKVLMALVLRRGMLRWELPSGIQENYEHLERTAEREVVEETGCEIRVDRVVATCWHHSRDIGRGWLGVIFRGALVSAPPTPAPFDFAAAAAQVQDQGVLAPAFDQVLWTGFVDWRGLHPGRVHPLHRQLLERDRSALQAPLLLVADADLDHERYDPSAPLDQEGGRQ